MAALDISQIPRAYPAREWRHPYNLWGFKRQKRRPKLKKKGVKKSAKRIDIYA